VKRRRMTVNLKTNNPLIILLVPMLILVMDLILDLKVMMIIAPLLFINVMVVRLKFIAIITNAQDLQRTPYLVIPNLVKLILSVNGIRNHILNGHPVKEAFVDDMPSVNVMMRIAMMKTPPKNKLRITHIPVSRIIKDPANILLLKMKHLLSALDLDPMMKNLVMKYLLPMNLIL
jgi:hypothetical protein